MKKFLCYDTNDAASGKIDVDSRGVLKANSTVPSTNGAPYQQLVTDGNGNTKWEDRLAYETDPVETDVFPEQTMSFSLKRGVYASIPSQEFDLVVDKTFIVRWDGAEYKCICSEYQGMKYIGNLSILKSTNNTGEPFLIFYEAGLIFATADTSPEHVISVTLLDRNTIKINRKFLEDEAVYFINYPAEDSSVFTCSKTFDEVLSAFNSGMIFAQLNLIIRNFEQNMNINTLRLNGIQFGSKNSAPCLTFQFIATDGAYISIRYLADGTIEQAES